MSATSSEPREHVLVSFAAEDAARHVVDELAREGIPVELLHVERLVAPPLRPPRRIAMFTTAAGAIIGIVAALFVPIALVAAMAACGGYAAALGATAGLLTDARRRARYERRQAARERSGYQVICPESALVANDW